MKKPNVSVHGLAPGAAKKRDFYLIQIHFHGAARPSFRLALLSDLEKARLEDAILKMRIASSPRLKEFRILPRPPLFDDADKLMADIAADLYESGSARSLMA